jgi:HEAT repeat protein
MLLQSRHQWLRFAPLAVGLAFASVAAPAAAQTTRQVSVESLIYDLNSPDAQRRQAAVRELGATEYRAGIPEIIALAHDPVDAVRREVEFTLERMNDIQALPGLIALASDNQNDIRARAVATLVNIHLPRATGVTGALSKFGELINFGPDRDVETVVEPDVPVDPTVVATLRARLVDPERGIRRTAIRGLGILRARPAIPDLLQVIREDRDYGLRYDSARAIRKIGDASIAGELVEFLNINNDTVRNELMATLGAMRFRGAVPELTRIVEQSKKVDFPTIVAMSALADIADPASATLFETHKADKNEWMRLYANEGIARTADRGQKTAISAARLIEKSPRVRAAQAFGLLRIGEPEYLDELIRGLESSATRDLAKEYLLETNPADRQALYAPRTTSPAARAELAEVLGKIGDPEALPRLQELAHDTDSEVARAAERAARRLALASSSQ